MEQDRILTWKNILILGIILSLSPFYIFTGSFYFHYSILGFGLALISFYYKKEIRKIDALITASLILILFSGIKNKFEWYSFFSFIFYFLVIVMIYLSSKKVFVKFISHLLVFIAGLVLPIMYFFLNFPSLFVKLIIFNYIFAIFSLFFLLFENIISITKIDKVN